MNHWMDLILSFVKDNAWIIESLVILAATAAIYLVATIATGRLEAKFSYKKKAFAESMVYAIRKPLSLLIWLIGITAVVNLIGAEFERSYLLYIASIVWELIALLIFIWTLLRVLSRTETRLMSSRSKKVKLDKTSIRALGQISRGVVVGLGVLLALPIMNIPISGVVAFGGFGGIAATFAAKDLLANFFGSAMIFMDRPFEVGDWIRLPERDIEGTVETIEWRLTRLRTFDKRPLYVPNSTFSYAVMENPSRMSHRRINTVIGIRYQDSDKLDSIVHDVKQMVTEHPEIDSDQTLLCNFIEFGSSSLNFIIYAFTYTIDWAKFYNIRQEIYFKTIDIIHQHGAKCALPATDIHFAEALTYKSQTS